jgi:hypothetical protein
MMDAPDQIVRPIRYCEFRAGDAERPAERDQFMILAQELRKRAAQEATRLAFEMPKRPAAPLVRLRRVVRKRA